MKNKKVFSLLLIVILVIGIVWGVMYYSRNKSVTKSNLLPQRPIYQLITPNGGEKIKADNTYEIKWDQSLLKNADIVEISLEDTSIKCPPHV